MAIFNSYVSHYQRVATLSGGQDWRLPVYLTWAGCWWTVGGLGAVTGWFGQGIRMEETMFFFFEKCWIYEKNGGLMENIWFFLCFSIKHVVFHWFSRKLWLKPIQLDTPMPRRSVLK